MKTTEIAAIFNEWYNRYVKDPSAFGSMEEYDKDYGDVCAECFVSIAKELGIDLG